MKLIMIFLVGMQLSGCALMNMLNTANTIQLTPATTTVSEGQAFTYQVSGGTPPYTYQATGAGSVDGSGDFQAGSAVGQAQVQVTDANNITATATVSVVQSAATSFATQEKQASAWTPTTSAMLKSSPPVQGQVIGVEDQSIDSQGDRIHSKFYLTKLKHPIVRQDELIQNSQVVATQAMIEDQFLVKLRDGFSEPDLVSVLSSSDAHISRRLDDSGSYLVSMNRKKTQANAQAVSPGFLSERQALKENLKKIATIKPNYISRTPASEGGGR